MGYSGTGNFTQADGTNIIPGLFVGSNAYLYPGYNAGSSGAYGLSGTGQLTASF